MGNLLAPRPVLPRLFVLDLYFHRYHTLHLVLFWVTTGSVVLGMLFCFYAEQVAGLVRRYRPAAR